MVGYKFTTKFGLIDEYGNEFNATSTMEIDDEFEMLNQIGEQFNSFLQQCTYYRPGSCMLMQSLTETERNYLEIMLKDYRAQNE